MKLKQLLLTTAISTACIVSTNLIKINYSIIPIAIFLNSCQSGKCEFRRCDVEEDCGPYGDCHGGCCYPD